MRPGIFGCILGIGVLGMALDASALTLVKDGAPQASIWISAEGDREPAIELSNVFKQMSGAELPVKDTSKDGKPEGAAPAILVGALARQSGLDAPPKTRSGDGYRIQTKGSRLLLAGESDASTYFAVSHLLESFGCRWFIDNEIGTVIPTMKTVEVDNLNIAEQPDFISRAIWGSSWNSSGWGRHNRLGGMKLETGHNWPKWFCTTDPQVRADYLASVVEREIGRAHV